MREELRCIEGGEEGAVFAGQRREGDDLPVRVEDSSTRRLAGYRLVHDGREVISRFERSVESRAAQGEGGARSASIHPRPKKSSSLLL